MNIQIYFYKRNFDVQKAERFFKERRVPYQLVDMKKHAPGERELRLFSARLGARALVDLKNVAALSHPVAHIQDADLILEYLAASPQFLISPVVRRGNEVTLGANENVWKEWLNAAPDAKGT